MRNVAKPPAATAISASAASSTIESNAPLRLNITLEQTMSLGRGYYRNSLKTWRERLQRERRLGLARLERMQKMKHPDSDDQALFVRHIEQMIEVIDSAQRVADALAR